MVALLLVTAPLGVSDAALDSGLCDAAAVPSLDLLIHPIATSHAPSHSTGGVEGWTLDIWQPDTRALEFDPK